MFQKGYFAVAVFIESPEGIPLVRDPHKPSPHFWKFPGGRSEENESAQQAAVREIREEVGLNIRIQDLEKVFEEDRGNHFFVFFKTKVSSLEGLTSAGNEDEEVKIFSLNEVRQMEDLHFNHKKALERLSS